MAAIVNLNDDVTEVVTGNDSIVIVDNFQSIRGGRALDTTGFSPKVINAGHVIIKETSTGAHNQASLHAQKKSYLNSKKSMSLTERNTKMTLKR